MVFFASIGAGILSYGVLHTFLTCICDCDLRLKFAEIFGKNIGNYFKIYVMAIGSMPMYISGALQGKVIWVVGASSGIGEHLSLWLARGGAKLVISSRRRDELVRVKQACHG